MATTYEEIYDLFLVTVTDYKLDNLYASSTPTFNDYLQGFLIMAIPDFTNCVQDLEDRSDSTSTFNITLTTLEKVILAKMMIMKWFDKEIQNVNQFNLHLNDSDFKHYAEANNLKTKNDYMVLMREKINIDMSNYGMANIPWADWANGNYGV